MEPFPTGATRRASVYYSALLRIEMTHLPFHPSVRHFQLRCQDIASQAAYFTTFDQSRRVSLESIQRVECRGPAGVGSQTPLTDFAERRAQGITGFESDASLHRAAPHLGETALSVRNPMSKGRELDNLEKGIRPSERLPRSTACNRSAAGKDIKDPCHSPMINDRRLHVSTSTLWKCMAPSPSSEAVRCEHAEFLRSRRLDPQRSG